MDSPNDVPPSHVSPAHRRGDASISPPNITPLNPDFAYYIKDNRNKSAWYTDIFGIMVRLQSFGQSDFERITVFMNIAVRWK
jgi:hypothetical protein